jgi:hypothetical protein
MVQSVRGAAEVVVRDLATPCYLNGVGKQVVLSLCATVCVVSALYL